MTQEDALTILKLGGNVYLTGTAGSGKTHLLEKYITFAKWRGKHVGITASTGIAATHLSGMTINSWAGVGVKRKLTEHDVKDLLKRWYIKKRLQQTDILVIDEISMLPSYTFENVDMLFRACKNNDEPFGGVQVILCGDFFQLPPVTKDSEEIAFIYKSPLWQELDLHICYLDKPFRQDDQKFLSMLEEIRSNSVTKITWQTLKERFFQSFSDTLQPTKLATHNSYADSVNERELSQMQGASHTYMMHRTGNEILSNMMQKSCLAPQKLVLKRGALVMFVKNNFEEGYVNGTLGKVVDFTEKDHYPLVETIDKRIVKATPSVWEIEEEGIVQAKITQIPLRLAWAITIHKSQGMTLDAAEIDLGKSFIEGLGYVALSRVRSLDGIKLKSINRTALTVNDEVIRFDKGLRDKSDKTVLELKNSYWYKKNQK